MNVNYIINIKVCTAEKRVLTNKHLLKRMISFMGKEKKLECKVCERVLKYQIFTQIVESEYKTYINCETCQTKYFCSDVCMDTYKKEYNNVRFCLLWYLILIFFCFIMCILIIVI